MADRADTRRTCGGRYRAASGGSAASGACRHPAVFCAPHTTPPGGIASDPQVGWGARGEVGGLVGAGVAAFAAAPVLWSDPATWLTRLDQAPPATPQEAQVSLAAVVAVICVALSLTAPFSAVMSVFAAPGLALAAWSLAHAGETSAPREFRWLAVGALAIGGLWLLALLLHFALALR